MRSQIFLDKIQFRTTFIWNFFWCDAYFRQCSTQKWNFAIITQLKSAILPMVRPHSEQITLHFLVSQNLHRSYRKLNYLDFILLCCGVITFQIHFVFIFLIDRSLNARCHFLRLSTEYTYNQHKLQDLLKTEKWHTISTTALSNKKNA